MVLQLIVTVIILLTTAIGAHAQEMFRVTLLGTGNPQLLPTDSDPPPWSKQAIKSSCLTQVEACRSGSPRLVSRWRGWMRCSLLTTTPITRTAFQTCGSPPGCRQAERELSHSA